MKTSKTLKVYNAPNGTDSRIIIQGKWLSQFGLSIGDYIEVLQVDNQLINTKAKPPKEDTPVSMKAMVSKQHLDLVKERATAYQTSQDVVVDTTLQYSFKRKRGL